MEIRTFIYLSLVVLLALNNNVAKAGNGRILHHPQTNLSMKISFRQFKVIFPSRKIRNAL